MRYASLAPLVAALALATCLQAPPAAQAVKDSGSMPKVAITVGDKTFVATLLDHATARAFTALLPMSVTMEELNGNEKFYRLPSNLPPQASTAFVMGFVRRDFGAAGFFTMHLTDPQLLVAMVTITLFVPCIASTMVVLKERGLGYTLGLMASSIGLAFLLGGLLWRLLLVLGVA